MSTGDPETTTEDQGEPLPPPKPFPWRQLALGVAILLCGLAIGAGGALLLGRQALIGTIRSRDRSTPELMQRMGQRLKLTPEQRKQVEEIVSKRMETVRQIREEVRPRVSEQMQLMRDEVAEVLSEEQNAAWREWFREAERFRRGQPPEFRRGRNGPGAAPDHAPRPRRGPPGDGSGERRPRAGAREGEKPDNGPNGAQAHPGPRPPPSTRPERQPQRGDSAPPPPI